MPEPRIEVNDSVGIPAARGAREKRVFPAEAVESGPTIRPVDQGLARADGARDHRDSDERQGERTPETANEGNEREETRGDGYRGHADQVAEPHSVRKIGLTSGDVAGDGGARVCEQKAGELLAREEQRAQTRLIATVIGLL